MTIEKKLLGTSPSGGGATDVAEVFSTYLYTGNGSGQTIYNGIDLKNEGGLVWVKNRGASTNHCLFDSARGASGTSDRRLFSNSTAAQTTGACDWAGFEQGYEGDPNGFVLNNNGSSDRINQSGQKYASWTFRKKEKFFDIVTVNTGNTTNTRHSHNLGARPHIIIGKSLNATDPWYSYTEALGKDKYLRLNTTNSAITNSNIWGTADPTDTDFGVNDTASAFGNSGAMVFYLFADNSAEDADDQMIKSEKYTGNGSTNGPVINLGWEPQFILIKRTDSTGDWNIFDTMRGLAHGADKYLLANTNQAEASYDFIETTSTGFQLKSNSGEVNASGGVYIWMAIRAEMMVEPKAATDVFSLTNTTGAVIHNVGLVPDMAIWTNAAAAGQNRQIGARLIGESYLRTNTSAAASNAGQGWDEKTGYWQNPNHASNINLLWKRAKGYMDCVTWKGNATARTVAHSLNVAPEMIWVKNRDATEEWFVYAASEGIDKWLYLSNINDAQSGIATLAWNNTVPSATVLSLGTHNFTNANNQNLIAYLFATLAGISKVGSYTGNGSYQTIPCGFSAGSRFILIKRTDTNGDWYVWDSLNGIVAGNDPHFSLNTTAAHVTTDDSVDPHNSGFIVNQVSATNINVSGGTYIFYAIA